MGENSVFMGENSVFMQLTGIHCYNSNGNSGYYAKSFAEAKILFAPDSYLAGVIGGLTEANGVKFLGTVLEGFIGMGFVKEPTDIFTPGTNKNVKTRSPAMVTFSVAQQDLGFNSITVPYAEVPTAIQIKVVDGWVGGTPNINYAWVGEVIKYMYINYIHAETTSYVVSEKTLAKLTPEDAATVVAVFQEQSKKNFTLAEVPLYLLQMICLVYR